MSQERNLLDIRNFNLYLIISNMISNPLTNLSVLPFSHNQFLLCHLRHYCISSVLIISHIDDFVSHLNSYFEITIIMAESFWFEGTLWKQRL